MTMVTLNWTFKQGLVKGRIFKSFWNSFNPFFDSHVEQSIDIVQVAQKPCCIVSGLLIGLSAL